MKLTVLTIAFMLQISCGSVFDSPKKHQEPGVILDEPVQFSGYVQRAFPITVDGISFNDSEHFYTRLVPDLIMTNPEYRNILSDAEIEIEGEYSLNRFGSNSSIFLSTDYNTGYIYETITDQKASFNLEILFESLEEIYRARAVLRIGLRILYPDQTQDHFSIFCTHMSKVSLSLSIPSP